MTVPRVTCAVALLGWLLAPAAAHAQESDSAMAMQRWQAYMAPGPAHEQLAKHAGEWTWESTMWMAPDAPPQKSAGTMSGRMIMDGRYLVEDWNGVVNGMPFQGHGMTGYDNAKGQYFDTWVDNFGTGVMTSWGTLDEATHTTTMNGSAMDPIAGKEQPVRSVTKEVDDDNFVLEMYGAGPDGKEMKMMELHAKRKG